MKNRDLPETGLSLGGPIEFLTNSQSRLARRPPPPPPPTTTIITGNEWRAEQPIWRICLLMLFPLALLSLKLPLLLLLLLVIADGWFVIFERSAGCFWNLRPTLYLFDSTRLSRNTGSIRNQPSQSIN